MLKPLAAALVVVGALAGPVLADAITGAATVIDGDTLEIRGVRIRVHGVDSRNVAKPASTRAGMNTAAANAPRASSTA